MRGVTKHAVDELEPFELSSAEFDDAAAFVRGLEAWASGRVRRRFLVLAPPAGLAREAATRCLLAAARAVDELVVVASERDRLAWGGHSPADLRGAVERPQLRVAFEGDREQAVVGTLLRLRGGDACLIVGGSHERALIGRGLAARSE